MYRDYIFRLKIHSYTYQKFKLVVKLLKNSIVIGVDSSWNDISNVYFLLFNLYFLLYALSSPLFAHIQPFPKMGRNVASIPKFVPHVIYPLRVHFILNRPSCQRVFLVLCVERRNKWLLCYCVISVNVVDTWHAWGHPWLLYHPNSVVVLTVKNLRYLVLSPIGLNDNVWLSSSCAKMSLLLNFPI